MRAIAGISLLATLLASVHGDPRIHLNDPRFQHFRRGVPGPQSRSACPGMNSLANHNFLPFDGNNLTAVQVTTACHVGLGLSPEVCAIIVLNGLAHARLPLDSRFPLEAIDKTSWGIIHDCSSSRIDPEEVPRNGPNDRDFNGPVWDVALRRIVDPSLHRITIDSLAVSKADIIVDTRRPQRDPKTRYNRNAAAHGAVENARLWITMATDEEPEVEPSYVKALFEDERLPVREGWIPGGRDQYGRVKFAAGGVTKVLEFAARALSPFLGRSNSREAQILQNTIDGVMRTKDDVLHELRSGNPDFLNDVEKLLLECGYTRQHSPEPYIELQELRRLKSASDPEKGYSPGDHIGEGPYSGNAGASRPGYAGPGGEPYRGPRQEGYEAPAYEPAPYEGAPYEAEEGGGNGYVAKKFKC